VYFFSVTVWRGRWTKVGERGQPCISRFNKYKPSYHMGLYFKTYFKTWEYALEKRKSRLLALFFPVYDMKWNAFII